MPAWVAFLKAFFNKIGASRLQADTDVPKVMASLIADDLLALQRCCQANDFTLTAEALEGTLKCLEFEAKLSKNYVKRYEAEANGGD